VAIPSANRPPSPIGVGVNPGHLDLDHELSRLDWKVKAGAEYAITQPVFDAAQLETFLERVEPMGTASRSWPASGPSSRTGTRSS
jgi:5,10-methylenetetrahydrofolate reductase